MVASEQRVGGLLSVNVGLPQDLRWHGRTVHTAVWKRPVSGRQMVRRLNIDGDGQGDLAGHGGEHRAVFVYQIESYRYWQGVLGRDEFEYGQFGENFTVQNLADDEVCIGDRYQIGEAVFEVTQPRVTCYRVGIRLDDPRVASAACLPSQARVLFPGAYRGCRAGRGRDREGRLRAGRHDGCGDRRAALPAQASAQAAIARAADPGAQRGLEDVLRGDARPVRPAGDAAGNPGLAAASPPPAWPGFRRLAVTAIERESETVVSVRMADPQGARVPAALPGQFLTVRLRPEPGGRPLLRSYSLSGATGADQYRISVKRERHGAASQFVHTRLRVGDQLEVAAPRGTFTLRPGEAPVLLISAGVGATPVLAMLHTLAAARSGRDIWWLHGARSGADEPFAAESRSLLAMLQSAHRHICYSRPGPGDIPGRDYQTAGRLSAPVLAGLGLPRDGEGYICGPGAFMADVSAALVAIGIGAARIRTEVFGAGPASTPGIAAAPARPPHPPAGPPGSGPLVAFARSDLTARWDPGYASLLELAEACDVPVRWSCRTGVCHTCETAVMSGAVGYTPEPIDSPAGGSALICCSQPRDDLVLDL